MIRPYQAPDAPTLLALYYDTVHAINCADYTPEQIQAWVPSRTEPLQEWSQRFAKAETLVAVKKGEVAGFANLEKNGTMIGMLYIHKQYQRQGIASKLLKQLEKRLKKRGVRTAYAEVSITARPFFQQQGYQVVRENTKQLRDVTFTNYLMSKSLHKAKEKNAGHSRGLRWSEILSQKAIDLLIVVAGVTIAFQLNNWKLDNDQQALGKYYAESLRTDLQQDIDELTSNLSNLKHDHDLVIQFLKRRPDAPAGDTLAVVLSEAMSFDTFTSHDNTYRTMTGANGLSTLSDRQIRSRVTDYYTQYLGIQRFERIYTEMIFRLFSYVSPFCDIASRHITDEKGSQPTVTRNFLYGVQSQLEDGIRNYTEALEKAKALKADL